MNATTGRGDLELDVTDFGPIVEAKVDLRPLTVFAGPSNTGKSYLAILIYALHRVFGGAAYFAGRRFRRGYPFRLDPGGPALSEETINALFDVAGSIADGPESPGQDSIVLPPPIADTLCSGFNALAGAVSDEIGRCFGVGEVRRLIRRGQSKRSCVVMRRRIGDRPDLVEHAFSLGQKPEFSTMVLADSPIPVDSIDDGKGLSLGRYLSRPDEWKGDISGRKFVAREILAMIGDMVLPSLFGPLPLPAFYLPADRTGVMHAHSVVVSALIASAPSAGLRPAARTPMLSGVLADFLEQLIEIGRGPRSRRKAGRDLGEKIEKSILSGSVRIDRSTSVNYPRFAYRPDGWSHDLALANASSMVLELAPVVLFLRHMVEPGNVLIVEEPESHLHPAMQIEFTRQLAVLVKAGIRVIVTTHSEWLLEGLANIVQRSKLSKVDGRADIALRPDQVGVWLFKPKRRPKGSVVKEIPLDDAGLYPSGYDEVAKALHNEWADIASRIGDDS